MVKKIQFGEYVEGHEIPVLNEREIRAAAGLLFLMMFGSIMPIIFIDNYTIVKYSITIFFIDILIRVFVSPKYSPSLVIGRWIVRNQTPEYVGAHQKKFAWTIGVILAAVYFTLQVVVNSYGPISGIICMICLIFLYFETAFGICLGCKVYPLFYKNRAHVCAGNSCGPGSKHEIQKTSCGQVFAVAGFVLFIVLIGILFHQNFSQPPIDLFGINSPSIE